MTTEYNEYTEYICGVPKEIVANTDYMQRTGRTECNPSKINREKIVVPVYRKRGAYNNLASTDPATQYYRQKLIQNTVRVKSSLYTMNLGALSVYQSPNPNYGVNWNQMSDRRVPHVQQFRSGSNSSSIWRKTGPGALSPGGAGVDIKHNSYERYLNRIKGKSHVRSGKIPTNFGNEYLPFNRAAPVYGGKTFKTGIIDGCVCPVENDTNMSNVVHNGIQSELHDVLFAGEINPTVLQESAITAISESPEIYNSYISDPLPEYMHDGVDTPNIKYGHWFISPYAI
jgi:hypothetical protein